MASLTLSPNLPNAGEIDLLGDPVIKVAEGPESLKLPVPTFEEAFADSPDTEGARRVRSKPQNAEGGGKVYFDGSNAQEFWDAIDTWQKVIAAMDRNGGTITYEPPANGTPITYEVESIHLTTLPQDGIMLPTFWAESEWSFTARPYGLLETQTIIGTPQTSDDPLIELEVPGVLGSVDALGKLTLTEAEGQDRSSVVWGLDTNYDPGDPTPVVLATVTAGISVNCAAFDASFAGDEVLIGGFRTLRATLTTSPLTVCGSGSQQHVGTWRHLVRLYGTGTGPIWVRLVYKLGSSPRFAEGDWHELQGLGTYYEVDLGLMRVLEAIQGDQTVEWRYEAYSETAGDTLAIHMDQLIPQPGGKARTELTVGTPSASSGPNSPDTLTDDATVGSVAWSNPSNAAASDDSRAVASLGYPTPNTSHYLKATDFDFAIPVGATVTGIAVDIERSTSVAFGVLDYFASIVKGGTILSPSYGTGAVYWPTIDAYQTLGGPTILWGTTWTPADINGTGFGVALAAGRAFPSAVDARIDHIRITVYYTEAPDEPDRTLHANQAMEIRSDQVIRETPLAEWGRLATEGSYLKIPPAGLEGRTHRLVARARRNDVDSLPDDVIDDEISATLAVTPRVAILGG